MRSFDEIREDLDDARERRDRLRSDLDKIARTDGDLDAGQQHRWENLTKGMTNTGHDIERLEDAYRDAIAALAEANPQITQRVEFGVPDVSGESHGHGDPLRCGSGGET
jgi:hypothetical protein